MNNAILEAQLPVYDNGKPSFEKICSEFAIDKGSLAKITNISPITMSRAKQTKLSPNTWEKLRPLLHILNMLWALSDGNAAEITRWLHEPRKEWLGLTPLDMMKCDRIDSVTKLLEMEYEGYGELIGG